MTALRLDPRRLTGCKPDEPEDGGFDVPECVEYQLDGCMALYPATYDQVCSVGTWIAEGAEYVAP